MLTVLIKQLFSAWETLNTAKVDYESELFKSYKDRFFREAGDSVSKTTILIEMASKKLLPDAEMLKELLTHLAMDAKKTNDTILYCRIEQIYDMFCLPFSSNDELHKVAYTALKEGRRSKGVHQVKTLKNYNDEMKKFFESEKTKIHKSHQQAKKTNAPTKKKETLPNKPQQEKTEPAKPATPKSAHKHCPHPELQDIIHLFPSSLFNEKIFSKLAESETIHPDDFSNLSISEMNVKYYNFLCLPIALKHPGIHHQVTLNLLRLSKNINWDLVFAIYNNPSIGSTSFSRNVVLVEIFSRLCGEGKHDTAMGVFQDNKALIDSHNYFRMLQSMEPNKEHITTMLELGLSFKMYSPNTSLMQYYLDKYGIKGALKDSVHSSLKSRKTTLNLHGSSPEAVKGIIIDLVEHGEDEENIVISHGGGSHVAHSQYTLNDMYDVQFFPPVKKAIYETVDALRDQWKDKYSITIRPVSTPRGDDHSNTVISKKTLKSKLKKITFFESTQKKPAEMVEAIAPDKISPTNASLPSSDSDVIVTTTTSSTQKDTTSNASQPETTGKMNPKASEYTPQKRANLYTPPLVQTNPTHFLTRKEESPTQPSVSPYMPPVMLPVWYSNQPFFAYAPIQPAYYMGHFENEINSNTDTEELNTPNQKRNITMG